jgi:hypothetical protein
MREAFEVFVSDNDCCSAVICVGSALNCLCVGITSVGRGVGITSVGRGLGSMVYTLLSKAEEILTGSDCHFSSALEQEL